MKPKKCMYTSNKYIFSSDTHMFKGMCAGMYNNSQI